MSLYDGLDMEEKSSEGSSSAKQRRPDVSGWGSSLKLLETQKQLQAKKATLLNLKKKQATTVAPVVDLRRRNDDPAAPLHFNMITGKLERLLSGGSVSTTASPFIGSEAPISLTGVTDEYDPSRPNEFDDYLKKMRQRKRSEERRKEQEEREKRRRDRDEDDERGRQRDDEEEDREREERQKSRRSGGGGVAIAPPKSLIEDDKASAVAAPAVTGKDLSALSATALSVASKIMAKMGYKEGQGLGRMEQGMSTALQVEKTSKRGGKIIHEKDLAKNQEPAKKEEVSNADLLRNPSKVILLRNMVGPGEVDAELEGETLEECHKYGKALKCVIFEIPSNPDDEAVRIFIEFERVESAIKALVDLNGRYFGGRIVKAGFYNLGKFRRLVLDGEAD